VRGGRVQNGAAPLHIAAEKGSSEVVRLLLDRGADVNTRNNVRAPRPLTRIDCRSTRADGA
jgi:ankyrin repeat protein